MQSIEALHEYLMSKHLAWRQVLKCDQIAIHPSNRDGLGCSSSHVHELISNIAAIGYVPSEVRAICVEIAAGDRSVHTFNERLISESSGRLAPIDCIRYASIVGSHTNQACRAFVHNIEHSDDRLTVDGKLSMQKLEAVDPVWASAIQKGISWLVISHEVTAEFPEYPALAQAAGNAAGQIASAENELQLARKVSQACQTAMRSTGTDKIAYSDVAPGILRSRPPTAAALPGIFSFVLKCGGGMSESSYLARSERFILGHGFPNRALGLEVWQTLSMDVKGRSQHVAFRHMVLKLALAGPEKTVSLADIRKVLCAKDMAQVIEAEAVLKKTQNHCGECCCAWRSCIGPVGNEPRCHCSWQPQGDEA